ncbi:Snare region anchored in the vesicle membrane C-terminus [Carpediemonas membranifera]|uniref:Snare region anchored in the vesicle membrane C-terminus n=1 Tax=Carpediemonas membranifera TaxID=201153 RepID=A0A8J6B4F3_9EUKA|nr:Snare region anchored in the vesicle membrane C-terminus [Carpediemonas membranifera]|eukprot:KAG9394099.1 Snare region anchored in the vesicle membrane C-terminus [Carpediemonas membranifera]
MNPPSSHSYEDSDTSIRNIERQIRARLIALSQLSKAIAPSTFQDNSGNAHSLAVETHTTDFNSISKEIISLFEEAERALYTVEDVETRSILRRSIECDKQEFQVARDNIQDEIDRVTLMSMVRGRTTSHSDGYMREKESLAMNNQLTEQLIGQARMGKEGLDTQAAQLKGMQSRIRAVEARMPGLRGILSRISRRENRDNLIVGVVIALLISGLLIYKLAW